MRVLIADDNAPVRRGIAGILSGEADFEVCGEAANSQEAIQKTTELKPDLILLDVSMPGSDGLDTARKLSQQFPGLKILMISQHDPGQLLPRSLEAGAHGCIDKARIVADLLPTVRSLLSPLTS